MNHASSFLLLVFFFFLFFTFLPVRLGLIAILARLCSNATLPQAIPVS